MPPMQGEGTAPFPGMNMEKNRDMQDMGCHAMLPAIRSSIDITMEITVLKTPRRPDTCREIFHIRKTEGRHVLSWDHSRFGGIRTCCHSCPALHPRRDRPIASQSPCTGGGLKKFRTNAHIWEQPDRNGKKGGKASSTSSKRRRGKRDNYCPIKTRG